jgi:cell wall assembly regulator SMI1
MAKRWMPLIGSAAKEAAVFDIAPAENDQAEI